MAGVFIPFFLICFSEATLVSSVTNFLVKLEKWQGMDSFYWHFVCSNFLSVEWYMCSYHKLKKLLQSSLNSNVLSCFFYVRVRVLGCVIVPVRNFKTSHYPYYPLPCEFRQNAPSDISHLKHSLFRNFKILDSAVKVVMSITHVTVPFVFFCSADGSTVVIFFCKEIKTFIITVAVTTTWPFKIT